jgi:hypothetical protein
MIAIDQDTGREFDLRSTDAWSADRQTIWFDKCLHARTEVRRRVNADGRVSYWPQCLRCGRFPKGQVSKTTLADPAAVLDADDTLYEAYQAEQSRKLAAINQKPEVYRERASA